MIESKVKYNLRDYQKDAISKAVRYVKSKNKSKVLMVAPTGAGKSIYISNIIKETGKKTIVLQPNIELLEQNYNKYKAYDENASIFCASLKEKKLGDVCFATIQSLIKAIDDVKCCGYELLICDEAHYMTKKDSLISQLIIETGITKVIGLTATPVEPRNYYGETYLQMITRSKVNLFNKIIHITEIGELVEKEFWSPIIYQQQSVDTSMLILNGTGSDYTDKSQLLFYESNNLFDKIQEYIYSVDRSHNIIYVPGIAETIELTNKLENAVCVYSGMPKKKRIKAVDDFKSGKCNTIINCNILTLGFDFPELDHVIMARPTNSFAIYYQQIGRGVRIYPNKKDVLITDFAGNIDRFGEIERINFKQDNKKNWDMYNGDRKLTNNFYYNNNYDGTSFDGTFIFGEYKGIRIDSGTIPYTLLDWVRRVYTPKDLKGKLFKEECINQLNLQ